ncbi:MAG: alpha/beta fold hydrolase [Acidobacteria bacterium]|nr:alpha/beta fold hydrolase [Acidobacteriota bacterium]
MNSRDAAPPLAWDLFDERPILVFLHAFPFDRRMWRRQVEDLSESARVLILDFPGFGESAEATAPPSLDAWADLVETTLDRLLGDEPAVICGLSMGGYVALRLAARHPGRLEALILADTRAGADSPEGVDARNLAIAEIRFNGLAPLADQLLPRLFSPDADPEAVDFARELMLAQDPAAVIAALAAMRDRPDSTPVLEDLHVPALVIVGANDELTPPAEAEAMARQLEDAWLIKIPATGHLSNLEAPVPFNMAIKGFLETL